MAGISIWLSVKREVKIMNTSLILCKAVTIWDTKFPPLQYECRDLDRIDPTILI